MADPYLQSLLGEGENVRSEARQHPVALIRFALQPILVFLGALVCLGIGLWLTPDGQGLFNDVMRWIDTLLGLLTAALFLVAIVWFPVQAFRWTKRRYMVTDRRVLYVDGVFRKNSFDAGLSMITDVGFRQGVLGRSLGYGDLVVATASNRPLHFRQIRDALAFKQTIMAAQHATVEARAEEILAAKGLAPAAVAAASVAAATTAAIAAPTAAAAPPPAEPVAPTPPPAPAWDGSDVPQMAEDDTPPADPLIFGEPVAEVAESVPEAVTEAEAVAAAPEAEALETQVDEVADAIQGVSDQTAEATSEVADAAGEAQQAVGDVADAATADGASTIADAADATEGAVADTVSDMAEATGDAAATPVPSGHVGALDDVDATIGGIAADAQGSGAASVTSGLAQLAELRDSGAITEADFEAKKQALLDEL